MTRLLIAAGVLLAAGALVWFAWLGPELDRGKEERAASGKINGFDSVETTWSGRVLVLTIKNGDDRTLQQIAEADLPQLRILKLHACQFTPQGLATLQKLPQIVELDLQETPLTPEGRDELAQLKHLERLKVRQTGLTFDDVKRLEKALPQTSIRY